MHVFVAGGAGFIGSHLCRALIARGDSVTVVDNLYTGKRANLDGLPLRFLEADLCVLPQLEEHFDAVINLACPASPPAYQAKPIETLDVGSLGTRNALELARRNGARFLLTSTSEVYGEPEVHPQRESYRGNVNPVGPRSMYDEAKRFSEALTTAYHNYHHVSTAIVRIFNTYGPRMQPDDGRVVTNFLSQALAGQNLTVYGTGSQTRSFCYVADMVRGLLAMLDSSENGPINLGNPQEITMLELAQIVGQVTGRQVTTEFRALPGDDPSRRRPDITLAQERLQWQPIVPLEEGLKATWQWLCSQQAH